MFISVTMMCTGQTQWKPQHLSVTYPTQSSLHSTHTAFILCMPYEKTLQKLEFTDILLDDDEAAVDSEMFTQNVINRSKKWYHRHVDRCLQSFQVPEVSITSFSGTSSVRLLKTISKPVDLAARSPRSHEPTTEVQSLTSMCVSSWSLLL